MAGGQTRAIILNKLASGLLGWLSDADRRYALLFHGKVIVHNAIAFCFRVHSRLVYLLPLLGLLTYSAHELAFLHKWLENRTNTYRLEVWKCLSPLHRQSKQRGPHGVGHRLCIGPALRNPGSVHPKGHLFS